MRHFDIKYSENYPFNKGEIWKTKERYVDSLQRNDKFLIIKLYNGIAKVFNLTRNLFVTISIYAWSGYFERIFPRKI